MAAENKRFFVTRESQEASGKSSRKESYAGLRDLTDLEKIKELDIVGPDGTLRGIKNRVRAGLATYENQVALVKRNTEEGKIVVYTTSFRGVRHTYEECRYILTVFHNLRVSVQERDIYVHQLFHRELEERLGIEHDAQLPVPQVYINGQHLGGKFDLEILNETGELRQLIANIPRQETSAKCQTCAGYQFIPCRKCGGSKNSVANNFTSEFRALRCTHCSENGMEPCPACTTKQALTLEEKEAVEAEKKEKELQEQLEKEKQEKEKREKIKREALEAEKELQLERERVQQEKEKKKKRAKLEKERKKRAAEIRQRVVADIAREAEREKQWQAEHEADTKEQDLTNESPSQASDPQECSEDADDKIEDEDHTSAAAIEEQESETATTENTEQPGEEVESTVDKIIEENDSSHDLPTAEVAENETETLF